MKVFIITEGSAKTGYGHLTRSLAIYQGFEEQNIIPKMIVNGDENGKNILGNIKLSMYNWISENDKLLSQINGADIAIVDSYIAELPIYQKISKSVAKTVYIDDYVRLQYPPGIILNGSVGAENLPYQKDDYHEYLLGLNYTPLRKAFWDIPNKKNRGRITNILITLGGQDIKGITFQVLDKVLASFPKFNYHVALGYNNYQEKAMGYKIFDNVNFYSTLSAIQMRDLMIRCDLAISAAGQTTYEIVRTRNVLIAVGIAKNQEYNIRGWLSKGIINTEIWYYQKEYLQYICKDIEKSIEEYKINGMLIHGKGVKNICRRLIN